LALETWAAPTMVAMLNIPLSKYVKITIQGANWEVTSVELLY